MYEGSTENVTGVLSIKDVLLAQASQQVGPTSAITDHMRPAYFVPETNSISDVFTEMRQSRQTLALAVDEFGGLAGMATLHGLLSEIVGDLDQEEIPVSAEYTLVDENTIVAEASIPISELNDELGLGLPEGNYQTLAGFLLEQIERIPSVGESFVFRDLRLTVIEMEGVRIKTLELRKMG